MLTETLNNLIIERRGNRSLKHYRYNTGYYRSRVMLRGKRILDIGCGSGLLLATNSVIESPALAVGIDNYKGEGSPLDELNFIRKLRQALGLPNLCFAVTDARHMAFRPESFDVIFASQFLHHIHIDTKTIHRLLDFSSYQPRIPGSNSLHSNSQSIEDNNLVTTLPVYKVLKDMYTMLARDGVLVVTEAPRYTAIRLMQKFGLLRDIDFTTKQEPSGWVALLKRCGFKDISIRYHTPYPLRYLAPLLETRLTRYLLSYQYYIFAYK